MTGYTSTDSLMERLLRMTPAQMHAVEQTFPDTEVQDGDVCTDIDDLQDHMNEVENRTAERLRDIGLDNYSATDTEGGSPKEAPTEPQQKTVDLNQQNRKEEVK